MKTIWKYMLLPSSIISMPRGARILSVGTQGPTIFVWAMVDPEEKETQQRMFRVFGTGHDVDLSSSAIFIGTVILDQFVFHVFEELCNDQDE